MRIMVLTLLLTACAPDPLCPVHWCPECSAPDTGTDTAAEPPEPLGSCDTVADCFIPGATDKRCYRYHSTQETGTCTFDCTAPTQEALCRSFGGQCGAPMSAGGIRVCIPEGGL